MGKVTTGAYQATGKKAEGRVAQANFARPVKVAAVKATGVPQTPSVKPFVRKALPGMRTETAGGLPRALPTKFAAGSHQVQPHIRNS